MYLVAGLGNPGAEYHETRHNVGFMFVDELAALSKTPLTTRKFNSEFGRGRWQGHELIFLKPLTYMNLSGGPVQEAMAFFKIPTSNLIVVFDDLDLQAGVVKMRIGGGHGGHNGVRDILARLGEDNFVRIKIGIGKPEHKSATANWVLTRFSNAEDELLKKQSFPVALDRFSSILREKK